MSVNIPPDSPYGRELWKWEHREDEVCPTDKNLRGMRPATRREYPAMMYKATGKNPWTFERELVIDEAAQHHMESRGFVAGGTGEAAKAFDNLVQSATLAAAHRNYEDRNMSEGARAHSESVEQASSRHLGEIVETPIRRRGRRPKAAA